MSMDRRSYEEKRGFIRIPVACEISLVRASGGEPFTATGRNLSAGGVAFDTDETLQPGDCLEMHIEAGQTLHSVLDATIEVLRVEPGRAGRACAAGCAITCLRSR
jgi:hypothetical protein